MAFSPNLFLANVRSKDGLAKPCRFEVILPIPPYINEFIGNSILEKILNLPKYKLQNPLGAYFFQKSSKNSQNKRFKLGEKRR